VLDAYLAWSGRAAGTGERKLRERAAQGKEDPGRLDERRGVASLPRPEGPLVWLHGASVGEGLSLLEMIRRMGEERPDLSFLLTTGTVTSAAVLADRLPPRTVHQYVPLDVRPWVRRFLEHWRPDLAVLAEGELWPALLAEVRRQGTPLALINARMTETAFRRWRWLRGAARAMLTRIDRVQAQDERTATRLRFLGLPPDRIEVTGTLKEGTGALAVDAAEYARLAGVLADRTCWLAASTHAGEEEAVARAHSQALRAWPRLLLILAPRHPDRADSIAAGLDAGGWRVARRSRGEVPDAETQVFLTDTMGEMGLWYRLCPVSFVGGSLAPVGGHNPFEPAALGSAILHGPHVENFADIYDRLRAAGGVREVADADALAGALDEVLEPDVAARLAHAAWEVCSEGADVTDRALDLLLGMLDGVE
jgi:3-deoxy-D-manno-octulosonic-acid transferase